MAKKIAFALLASLLLLAGCGQTTRHNPNDKTNAGATDAIVDNGHSEQTEPESNVDPVPEPEPEFEPEPVPETENEPDEVAPSDPQHAEIEKIYHMNKNYSIVPNDPEADKKVVLLTFDDGPKKREMIEPMLDILDKHQAKAIFFVNGDMVELRPELLKLIHDRGQIIGNHSFHHIELRRESNEKIDREIEDTQKIVFETIGVLPQFFRPPHASSNDYVKEKVKQEGMLFMTWSNGSLDWKDNRNNPDGIIKSVLEQLGPGSNILMHELPWTVEALDELLTVLSEKGYSFVDPRAIELEMR